MTTDPRPTAPFRSGKPPTAKTKLGGVAVVCGKCAKRAGLRPKAVGALLKDAYRDVCPPPPTDGGKVRRRKLCVVESGCLGPCPKRLVAVATGASLATGRVLLLDPKAGPEGARAALLPEFGPNGVLAAQPNDVAAGKDPPRAPRRPD